MPSVTVAFCHSVNVALQPAEPPDMLQPRQLIAAHSGKQYLVEHILGKGGFGEVYQVYGSVVWCGAVWETSP